MSYENVDATEEVVETTDENVVEEVVEVEASTENATPEEAAEATTAPVASVGSIAELAPKMKMSGTVTEVKLYGAFVELGVERPALLHISQVRQKRVRNVSDHVNVGDNLDVWVISADAENGRVEVTLVEPPALAWEEISVNDLLKGTVVRTESFGAFVNIGAERPGLIHVSELANDFVESTESVVSVGDEVEVRVINVDKKKKQVDLSIKAVEEAVMVEEDDEEEGEVLTAMALALKEAMEGARKDERKNNKQATKASLKEKSLQDEIIARTLGKQ